MPQDIHQGVNTVPTDAELIRSLRQDLTMAIDLYDLELQTSQLLRTQLEEVTRTVRAFVERTPK